MDLKNLIKPKSYMPMYFQAEAAECGLACLAMVSRFYGAETSLISMRTFHSVSLGGASLFDLINLGSKIGLASRALRIELQDLKNLRKPCILHWDLNHFVVLKSVSAKKIIIHDPAMGIRSLSHDEVSKHFTGMVMEIWPTEDFKKEQKSISLNFSDLWSRITGLKTSLLVLFFLSLILQIFILINPYYIQLVVDDVLLTNDVNLMNTLLIGFSLVLLFEVITNATRSISLIHFGNLFSLQLGANLFHHLIRLPTSYFEKRHLGDIISRFNSIHEIRRLFTAGILETAIDGLMAILTVLIIFYYSSYLALVVMLSVVLYGFFRVLSFKSLRNANELELVHKAKENTYFMESMRAIQTIKLFSFESSRESQWLNKYSDAVNYGIVIGKYHVTYTAINNIIFGIESLLVVYIGAFLIMDGQLTVGMLIAFLAYKRQFVEKMINVVSKIIDFKMIGLHLERLSDIALSQKENSANSASSNQIINGKLTVKGLTFSYNENLENILNNLNFEVQVGESVAIIGPSGVGKSTLLKLMLGLISPNKGSVLIDGEPLESIGHDNYRKQIAAVMQDDELLTGTISENISFFDEKVDLEFVYKCAKLAEIDHDISKMPMKYDSLIGDMGANLSGGQKQRLLLARALYKQPKILFMDEATSHLDLNLESKINDSIRKLNITRVIIAHRKETIESADRIISLY